MKRSCEDRPRRSAFLFQVSGELCLLADVIQRQYLLIRICTGDRADGQDHVELSVTVSVCANAHVRSHRTASNRGVPSGTHPYHRPQLLHTVCRTLQRQRGVPPPRRLSHPHPVPSASPLW